MKEYFASPLEKKVLDPISPGGFTRGYIGLGAESGGSSFEVRPIYLVPFDLVGPEYLFIS